MSSTGLNLSPVAGVGLPGDLPAQMDQPGSRPLTAARPYLRVELCASIVPNPQMRSGRDPNDNGRWYQFAAGCGLDQVSSDLMDGASGVLNYEVAGANGQTSKATLTGPCGIDHVRVTDSLRGQSCSVRMMQTDLVQVLARLVRPQDRLRVVLVHPVVPASQNHQWVAYDGPLGSARGTLQGSGGGIARGLTLQGSGLQGLLAGATYNWQGIIHPDSDILKGAAGLTLSEQLAQAALPVEQIVRAFLESALNSALSLRLGDWQDPDGLAVLDYFQFSPTAWRSVEGAMFPLAYQILQSQSGNSFWGVAQSVSEPHLHEFFVALQAPSGQSQEIPTLVHRPLPFPGLPARDSEWLGLPHYAISRADAQALPFEIAEDTNGGAFPNTFNWAGVGMGDQSTEVFNLKGHWGYLVSNAMVNRFGYHSVGMTSKVAPLNPDADPNVYLNWIKAALTHFATQNASLPLMRSRHLAGQFFPVRPGWALTDGSLGDSVDAWSTGYVTESVLTLAASREGFSLRQDLTVERAVWGTDFAGYPDAARALVQDLDWNLYAGADQAPLPPEPNQGGTYVAPQMIASHGSANPYDAFILGAAARSGIKPWLIAHMLVCESSMGRNVGSTGQGVAQITQIAATQLIINGYQNPDTSPFKFADRGDPQKCIYAAAAFLAYCKAYLSMPSNAQFADSWTLRAYHLGAPTTKAFGLSNGWQWPLVGEPEYSDYARYWSPGGVAKAFGVFGYLGGGAPK